MELPFTIAQFYGVFRDYNTAVWPAQCFLVVLALGAVASVLRPQPWSDVAVSTIPNEVWRCARPDPSIYVSVLTV